MSTINYPDMDKYAAMFAATIPEQIKRMKENEHKTGWDDMFLDSCDARILENCNDIDNISGDSLADDLKSLIYHYADIANYASMAILKAKKILDGEAEYEH